MDKKITKIILDVGGMTCTSCEARIERGLRQLPGIIEAKADFTNSKVFVTYDEGMVSADAIKASIIKSGYDIKEKAVGSAKNKMAAGNDKLNANQVIGIAIILVALYVIVKNTIGFNFIPQINQSMSYGILFVVGLLTSLHCIAMCGGINLSQCVAYKHYDNTKASSLKPSFLYNMGRVVSYTLIGGIVGALGSVVSFSGVAKGVVAIIAGVFMVIMGLNMLNIFPWLRKLNPHMPKIIGEKLYKNSDSGKYGPFYIGLLNGLMPCGPLQSMQLYALGTGSFTAGALSMLMFSLGTVPLMFGFGAVSSALGKKFTSRLLKVSAVLVIMLGFIMLGRGFALSGISVMPNMPQSASKQVSGNVAKIENGVQTVSIDLKSGRYTPIVVQKGIPVRFIINADDGSLNGCNNAILIPKYNIQKKLEPGANVIEFTPEQEGNIPYSCWMGMIKSNISVVSDVTNLDSSAGAQAGQTDPSGISDSGSSQLAGGSCCSGTAQTGNIGDSGVFVAKAGNNVEEVTIDVNGSDFSPSLVVLQKGTKAKIKFKPTGLTSCNQVITFPEYGGQLDLSKGQLETPELEISGDFTFSCWMGMINGYVKVVDDVNNINIDEIKKEAAANISAGGGGGCCGN